MKYSLFIITLVIINYLSTNAQSLTVFDIDSSEYPVMSAKYCAFDKDLNMLNHLDKSEFEIYEDGIAREVISVDCPTPKLIKAISSVLTIDISGSMRDERLDKAKEPARAWIDALPDNNSECAITSFDHKKRLT